VANRLFVGAISGTSVDGLDLALLRIDDGVEFVGSTTRPFPPELRDRLIDLGQRRNDDLDSLGRADTALGRFASAAILEFLAAAEISPADVTAIGWHGQTVRHRPDGPLPFTLQIGDPNQLAELTGIPTVADFRRRDMAAGGQAAPLVPPFHRALFDDPNEPRVVANIGGISNISVLRAGRPVTGFDTGPGNALLDAWYQVKRSGPYDAAGAWAATGRVIPELLATLLTDPYLALPPPKSTGKEYYHLEWLEQRLGAGSDEDVQRTLVAFTAASLADAVERWAGDARRVLVCGGGRLNPVLMEDLRQRLVCPVDAVEAQGVDGDAIEAGAFAWLASRRLAGEPGNEPAVTGAAGERILGGVYLP
jgi:anhydro-N-acetylmuramic acid kinase